MFAGNTEGQSRLKMMTARSAAPLRIPDGLRGLKRRDRAGGGAAEALRSKGRRPGRSGRNQRRNGVLRAGRLFDVRVSSYGAPPE